jgi:hypothetical protein
MFVIHLFSILYGSVSKAGSAGRARFSAGLGLFHRKDLREHGFSPEF